MKKSELVQMIRGEIMYDFLYEGKAAEEAKKKGYVSAGWGRWKKGKSGPVVAKTVGDKLVPVKAQKPGAPKVAGKKGAEKIASKPTSKSDGDEFGIAGQIKKSIPKPVKPAVNKGSPAFHSALEKLRKHPEFKQKFADMGVKLEPVGSSSGRGYYLKARGPNNVLLAIQPTADLDGHITSWNVGKWDKEGSYYGGGAYEFGKPFKTLDDVLASVGKGAKKDSSVDKITASILSGKGTLNPKQAVTYAKAAKKALMRAKDADDFGVGKDKNGNAQIWLAQPGSNFGSEGMGGSMVHTMTIAPNGKAVIKVSLNDVDRKSENGTKYTEKYDNPARAFQALLNNDI